jgi:hypothetical protein
VRPITILLPLLLLGGCAGYAVDYTKSRESLVGPELRRYGFTPEQTTCVTQSLTSTLKKGQLGILARTTGLVKRGYSDRSRLQPSDILYVATFVEDREIPAAMSRAAAACNILTTPQIAAAQAGPPSGAAAAAGGAAAIPSLPPTRGSSWLNLGAAPTGQAIAIDAASVQDGSSYRQAWFRITNPGDKGPTGSAYLLRVDCTGRTINPMALRKHDASGAVSEEKQYGPNGEGALKVEGSTVMEIAYLALCT